MLAKIAGYGIGYEYVLRFSKHVFYTSGVEWFLALVLSSLLVGILLQCVKRSYRYASS
jgi:hypothetical protein